MKIWKNGCFLMDSYRSGGLIYVPVLIFLLLYPTRSLLGGTSQPNPMGKPYISMLNDLRAGDWNPASIAGIKTTQIAVMSTAWESAISPLQATSVEYARAIDEKYTAAFRGGIMYAPESQAFPPVSPSTQNFQITGSGGLRVNPRFHAGGRLGVGNVLNVGLGGLWWLNKSFIVGTSLNWELARKSDIPTLGSSYKLGFSVPLPEYRIAWGFSASIPMWNDKDEGFLLDTSLEKQIPVRGALLSFRLGYTRKYKHGGVIRRLRWLSGGATLEAHGFQVDYDFIPYFGDRNTHRISILYKFPASWQDVLQNPSSQSREIEEAAYKLAAYYYNNEQYYESINNCQDVLQHGEEYPSMRDARAHILLARNYQKLGDKEGAKAALETLQSESFKGKLKDDNKYESLINEVDQILQELNNESQ